MNVQMLFLAIALSTAGDVVELNANTFQSTVLSDRTSWVVLHYAHWCQYCTEFMPVFSQAAAYDNSGVRYGAVDCAVDEALCDRNGVENYPTVLHIANGRMAVVSTEGFSTKSADNLMFLVSVLLVLAAPHC